MIKRIGRPGPAKKVDEDALVEQYIKDNAWGWWNPGGIKEGGTPGKVTQWDDETGNGRHLTAASNFPDVAEPAVNGHKGISFQGTNTQSISFGSTPSNGYMLMVGQFITRGGTKPKESMFVQGGAAGLTFFFTLRSGSNDSYSWGEINGASAVSISQVNTDPFIMFGAAGNLSSDYLSIAFRGAPSNVVASITGSSGHSTASNFDLGEGGTARSGDTFGERVISEVILFSAPFLYSKVGAYLSRKYNIQQPTFP